MKTGKRMVAFLVTVALCAGLLPVFPAAASAASGAVAYAVEGGNIYFNPETGAITDCDESVTAANIPSKINGVAVTRIVYGTFSGCKLLVSITIPSSVTSVVGQDFSSCSSLVSIDVAKENAAYCSDDGVLFNKNKSTLIRYPGKKAEGLYAVPSSVTSIGNFAFDDCDSLTSITIPSSVMSIGDYAFFDCDSLTSITIPSSVTKIPRWAFYSCDSLTSITIPSSVTSIMGHAFSLCTSLTSITIPSSVTSIEDGAFSNCDSLTSVTIPSGVTKIGDEAFYKCDLLTSVTIPSSVTSIGRQAFYGCGLLASIDVADENATYCSEGGVLFSEDKTELICYPGGKPAGSYKIPSSVMGIRGYAFYSCSSLVSVTIPSSVASINGCVFDNCTSLASVTMPSSVTGIGNAAFKGCTALSDIYYSGTEEEWNSITIGYENEPLTSAVIHFNDTGSGVVTEEKSDFELGKDNFGFSHSPAMFFSEAEREIYAYEIADRDQRSVEQKSRVKQLYDQGYSANYQISDDALARLLSGTSFIEKYNVWQRVNDVWGGSCFGLSNIIALRYADPARVPLSGLTEGNVPAECLHELFPPVKSTSVEDIVNYYHLQQCLNPHKAAKKQLAKAARANYPAAVKALVKSVTPEFPVLVGIEAEEIGHAVVLLDIVENKETSEYYVAQVYDPNNYSLDTYGSFSEMKIYKERIGTKDGISISYQSTGVRYAQLTFYAATINELDRKNFFTQSRSLSSEVHNETILEISSNMDVVFSGANFSLVYTNGELVENNNVYGPFVDSVIELDESVVSKIYFIFDIEEQEQQYSLTLSSEAACNADLTMGSWMLGISSEEDVDIIVDNELTRATITANEAGGISAMILAESDETQWPWDSIAVDIADAKSITLGKTANGAELQSDNLSAVTVAALSGEEVNSLEVSTSGKAVEIMRGSDEESDSLVVEIPASGISVSKQEISFVELDKSEALTVEFTPANASNQDVSWSSSAPDIASVDDNGVVTAVSNGTATITVTTEDGGFTDTCEVTVSIASVEPPEDGDDSGANPPEDGDNPDGGDEPEDGDTPEGDGNGSGGTGNGSGTNDSENGNSGAGGDVDGSTDSGNAGSSGGTGSAGNTNTGGSATPGGSTGAGAAGGSGTGGGANVPVAGGSAGGEPGADEPWINPFTDVAEDAWYYGAVEYVACNSIMVGYDETTFAPDDELSRAMLAQILYNLEGRPETAGNADFDDIDNGAWYVEAVAWAAEQGYMEGHGNGKFGPDDPITREQVAAVLYRYAMQKGYDVTARGDLSTFADADTASEWAQDALEWTVAVGLMQGYDGELTPADTATRAEIATLLQRFLENII